jgi:hypothetical protein
MFWRREKIYIYILPSAVIPVGLRLSVVSAEPHKYNLKDVLLKVLKLSQFLYVLLRSNPLLRTPSSSLWRYILQMRELKQQ